MPVSRRERGGELFAVARFCFVHGDKVATANDGIKSGAMKKALRNGQARPPAVAGLFYPGDAEELRAHVDRLLANAAPLQSGGRIRAIIAPHAGYVYSGPLAARAFAALRPEQARIRRAVVIGPAHTMWTPGIAASEAPAFATPLGELPVDAAAIDEIASLPAVTIDDRPHAQEHSLEVELPFLQRAVGTLPIVPLVVGGAASSDVAEVLERLWDDDTVVIVSSDLSHYLPYRADAVVIWKRHARSRASKAPRSRMRTPAAPSLFARF